MVALMGDLRGAFPKTWRALVIVLAKLEAQVMGSRLVLLQQFFKHTAVQVTYSGNSVVETDSGLPEWGMLGPLLYPLVPRLLDKRLAALNLGVGVDIPHDQWHALLGLNAVSSTSAAALSSLDALATLRIHIMLVADD